MESKGRRGSRARAETAGQEEPAIVAPEIVAPAVATPVAAPRAASLAKEEPVAGGGDSLTALAAAEEALVHAPESPPAPTATARPAADDLGALGPDAWTAFVKSQMALARGLAAIGVEMAGLARSGIDASARAASGLLTARTPTDAIRLQTEYVRSSLGAAITGSARLSNLGIRIAAETAEPLVLQFGRNWLKAVRRAH